MNDAKAFNSLACCRYVCGQQMTNWRMPDVSIATPFGAPRFERAPEAALVKHPEEGRGLDPQWETTQSLCRSPDRLTFRIWRMAEHSKPMPYGTIGVQSRAGEPCRFTIRNWPTG